MIATGKRRPAGIDPLEWIGMNSVVGVRGCWTWTRGLTGAGYGEIQVDRKMRLIHRYAWERLVGPIPDGMFMDHICRNRACWNVEHLRVVTSLVNNIENSSGFAAVNAAKTRCPRGHEYDEANTYMQLDHRSGRFGRVCRKCRVLRNSPCQYDPGPGEVRP